MTLSGAHSVGHVHPEFSGFGHPESATMTTAILDANPTLNAWDKSPDVFDNQYYQSLIGEVLIIHNQFYNCCISIVDLDQCPT